MKATSIQVYRGCSGSSTPFCGERSIEECAAGADHTGSKQELASEGGQLALGGTEFLKPGEEEFKEGSQLLFR